MIERYEMIMKNLRESRQSGDMKAVRSWRKKLENWQREYGACAPVR